MREGLLTYFNRASLCALFLTLRNFPSILPSLRQRQQGRSRMVIVRHAPQPACGITMYLHVGFCVARLDWIGTWKGRSEWDGQGKGIPRFCLYMS